MKGLIKISFFIAAIFCCVTAKAQQDYVITTKGDTLHCKVNIPFIGGHKYKAAGMADAVKISTDDIKEYYIARKKALFLSVFKNGGTKREFMPVLEKGKINLYEVVNNNYGPNGTSTSTTTWYVSKGTDNAIELKTSGLFLSKSRENRKNELADMFKDNKAVYDKYMTDDDFGFKQIRNLVHLYNTGEILSR